LPARFLQFSVGYFHTSPVISKGDALQRRGT
jgi:hypothetical protein